MLQFLAEGNWVGQEIYVTRAVSKCPTCWANPTGKMCCIRVFLFIYFFVCVWTLGKHKVIKLWCFSGTDNFRVWLSIRDNRQDKETPSSEQTDRICRSSYETCLNWWLFWVVHTLWDWDTQSDQESWSYTSRMLMFCGFFGFRFFFSRSFFFLQQEEI